MHSKRYCATSHIEWLDAVKARLTRTSTYIKVSEATLTKEAEFNENAPTVHAVLAWMNSVALATSFIIVANIISELKLHITIDYMYL